MRPEHLILENLGSFRGRHDVDFADIDLFVLSGPTGAGKSTILDAITLALYGSVPRYDNANLIEPAINKLATQATVSLTFTTGGLRYISTRQLARTQSGASAREVRLERVRDDGSTTALASGAREVDAAIIGLLGLTFDEFCKTVVLPQGAFAQFLHGSRKERQELLVRLLGLEIYQQIGQAARAEATGLEARIAATDHQLDRIGAVDAAAVAAAEAKLEQVKSARQTLVGELLPRVGEIRGRWIEVKATHDEKVAAVDALEAVERPDEIDDLAARVRAADESLKATQASLEEARKQRDAAQAACDEAPPADPAEQMLRLDEQLGRVLEQLGKAAAESDALQETVKELENAAKQGRARLEDARADLAAARRHHSAYDLASHLTAGEDCPVCMQTVQTLPQHDEPEGLVAAEATVEKAQAASVKADAAARDASNRAEGAGVRLQAASEEVERLRRELEESATACGIQLVDGRADRAAIQQRVDGYLQAQKAASEAQRRVVLDEKAVERALATRQGLDTAANQAWGRFDAARDRVTRYGAPAIAQRDDLAAAWDGLLAWAHEQLTVARDERDRAQEALRAVNEEGLQHSADIRSVAHDVGVEVADDARPEQVLEALGDGVAASATEAQRLSAQLTERKRLVEERQNLVEEHGVAELVGRLLRRDQLEAWLLNRLSTQLVAGASGILADLTQGAFSLVVDANSGAFQVIDHLNADERRPAKTLSGGETFLASLALALALAEHVTTVSQAGAARLDALFLDEGFGALDPETLETVAAAIEELSGSRMVGVITHVKELAARMPYRFDVFRGPDGSKVMPLAPEQIVDGDAVEVGA